jgi:hypothetical protein
MNNLEFDEEILEELEKLCGDLDFANKKTSKQSLQGGHP